MNLQPASRAQAPRAPCPVMILAEDDDELRKLMARKLRRRPCEVLEARNGAQLAELVFEYAVEPLPSSIVPASLIITDHRMPGRTGLEILALLRSVNWTTPVIVISAFADPRTKLEATRLGVSAVFEKPLDLDELVLMAWQTLGLDQRDDQRGGHR
jgi:CheY-like chemotaxis protein